MRVKTSYICSECGYKSSKWMGKCPECGEWNTFSEQEETKKEKSSAKPVQLTLSRLKEVESSKSQRLLTGIGEFDRVMGGGIVRDSVTILTLPSS